MRYAFEARAHEQWAREHAGDQGPSNYLATLAEAEAELPRLASALGCALSEVRIVLAEPEGLCPEHGCMNLECEDEHWQRWRRRERSFPG